MPGGGCHASAFGLTWASDIALDAFDAVDAAPADVTVRRVATLPERDAIRRVNRGFVHAEGLRLVWGDEVAFDLIGGTRIDYRPGAGWRGAMPKPFFGTIAALTLALRGTIPFHACAVEVDGRGILIAGASGAGKSSLTAGLIGIGARLVADDLAAVGVDGARIALYRGRPAMRQHPDTAARIDADLRAPIAGEPRGKWLVRPRARTVHSVMPLAGVIALSNSGYVPEAEAKLALLATQMFRPRWLAALPDRNARRRDLLTIAARVPLSVFPAMATFDPDDQRARAERALALIAAMVAARP